MNSFMLEAPWMSAIGWTLVHSIWQIVFVAIGLRFALLLIDPASADKRYVAGVAAMALVVLIPCATYYGVTTRGGAQKTTVGRPQAELPAEHHDKLLLASRHPFEPHGVSAADVGPTVASFSSIGERINTEISKALPLMVVLWMFGVGCFSFRVCGGFWRIRRYKRRETQPAESAWQLKLGELREKLGVKPHVRFLVSRTVDLPMVAGVFKPIILVPASAFLQMSPAQLETILAHELIHVRRYDPLVNICQCAVECLFFYHPAVWWISRQIRREREFATDAAVLEGLRDSRMDYASALARLEEIRFRADRTAVIAAAANGGNLMLRIQRILQKNTETTHASSASSAMVALAIISALLLGALLATLGEFVKAGDRTAKRKVAIGFVSIPPVDRTENPPKDSDATARLLIEKLKRHKVPAIGFVLGSTISDGEKLFPVRASILKLWIDAGFDIGIGNFKHVWFYHTPLNEYIAGVEKNEGVVKKVLNGRDVRLKYFSYPYLNTGRSVEDRDRFEAWLKDRGLISVKYTIDNQEWMYSYAYDQARNDNDLNTMAEIRTAYIDYMTRMFEHAEAYSKDVFQREIPQTLVLTPSRLVTDTADEVFGMIRKRAYSFVTMDEALGDEAFQTPETMVGEFGTSWFDRWTSTIGKALRREPEVDRQVDRLWKARQGKH